LKFNAVPLRLAGPLTCRKVGSSRSRKRAEASTPAKADVALRINLVMVASQSAEAAEASCMPEGIEVKAHGAGVAGTECRG
jgi:hypothetical protein